MHTILSIQVLHITEAGAVYTIAHYDVMHALAIQLDYMHPKLVSC